MKRCILNKSVAARRGLRLGMLAAYGLAAFFISGAILEAASPDLSNTVPRGAKRGGDVKVTLTGNRMHKAEEILFHEPGITAKEIKPSEDGKKVEVTFAIAPDCRLGEHQFRVRCADGTSYARTFWISQYDNVAEVEPNDFETPQEIKPGITIEGEAKPEDVDYYKIALKKDQVLNLEVEAIRINNINNRVAVDPYVAVVNAEKFELAASDDSALLKQDSVLSFKAPEDGDYFIEVRDSAYQGNGKYRVHVGDFPRPTGVYPAGGKAGSEIEVTLIGDPKGEIKQKVKLPGDAESHQVFAKRGNAQAPSGNKLRVSPFDNILEAEPNNDRNAAAEHEAKPLPLAFNGILNEDGDTDYFKFSAKKGQKFRFRSYANRIGTPVDTVIYVYDAKGKSIGSSDDADGSTDSRVDFTAPADGEYFLRVRDMLNRGGSDFVYRVESEPYTPSVQVTMPEFTRRNNQYRKQMDIPAGGTFATVVNVSRKNYSGELKFDLPDLPPGVTFEADTIPGNLSQVPVVFHAKADAPIGGKMVPLLVKNVDPEKPVTGRYDQMMDFVRGNPNGALYYTSSNDTLPVSVVEKAPFAISIEKPSVPIVRNGTLKLKVKAQRNGYDGKIVVRMLWRPPGISCPATININEKQNEATYELTANGSAEVRDWKITMLAEADAGKGQVIVAAPFQTISVEEPYVNMKFNLATVPQGQKVNMLAEVEQLRPFEGNAKVRLYGLPAKATTPEKNLTKALTELGFDIATTEETPVGQHKNVFAVVEVMKNNQPIVHRVGMGGVLRVDPKPKKPAPKPDQPKEVAENKAPAKKPLSRLEQLRLEAKKQAESQK